MLYCLNTLIGVVRAGGGCRQTRIDGFVEYGGASVCLSDYQLL